MNQMQADLQAINNIYLEIQRHLFPASDDPMMVAAEADTDWAAAHPEALRQYQEALNRITVIVPSLSPREIIAAYTHGSTLLQMNLSGYMGRDFVPEYIPTMTEAIRSGHFHTGWLFLHVLARHAGRSVAPLIQDMLQSPNAKMRETALAEAADLHLIEAIPQIQMLLNDPVDEIAILAQQTLQRLQERSH
jgi:hypothetical protein